MLPAVSLQECAGGPSRRTSIDRRVLSLGDRRDVGLRRPQRRGARTGAEADLLG